MKMTIAVPLDTDLNVYTLNPWTAPLFAIYLIEGNDDNVTYQCLEQKKNPWIEEEESILCDPMMCEDGCSDIVKADLNHPADHYIILEVVNGCTYLIAKTCCRNVEKVLENGGIEIYLLPPIIKDPDLAIKRLLVNLKFTNSILNIHKRLK
ncbi:MAG: hypothetical protein PF439_10535 [Helicobacteraceae bacterium]|jgi:hypothetical protein|nr:hypothetical protein [Helicobacteraceae bacterium]